MQYEAIKAEAAEAAQQATAGQQPFSELVQTGCVVLLARHFSLPALVGLPCVQGTL